MLTCSWKSATHPDCLYAWYANFWGVLLHHFSQVLHDTAIFHIIENTYVFGTDQEGVHGRGRNYGARLAMIDTVLQPS